MDTLSSTNPSSDPGSGPPSHPGSMDETPRVKFLCSFLGSIMPRPQDGKLRYVGGETRIVSLPRDVTCEELMLRMKELYEGVAVLKYQQPDEDLDALVSVVNDDDVINMMEEYDKLGSVDGLTRLRIFLFPHPDQDVASPYFEGDERESERRYVDALNNLNDVSDFRMQQQPESPIISPVDDIHLAEQFFNLHNLRIPHMGSGQFPQPITHWYNEMDAPWSPAYYSPRHQGHYDPRPLPEFPSSPSSARYRMPFGEPSEEYARQQVNHQPMYDHQAQFSENIVWLPTGAIPGDRSGFPSNILHTSNAGEGNRTCEHCCTNFHRNQPHLDQSNMGNGHPQVANHFAECPSNTDTYADAKLHHGMYGIEHNDPWSIYNESQNHDRGWNPQNHMSSNFVPHRAGTDMVNDMFHDLAMAAPPHIRIPSSEEHGIRNSPYAYGTDNPYPFPHGHVPGHVLWRNAQNQVHGTPSYESRNAPHQVNGTSNPPFVRGIVEGSPRFCVGANNQNPWVESSPKVMGFDGPAIPEYSGGRTVKLDANTLSQENQQPYSLEAVRSPADMLNYSQLPHSSLSSQLPQSSSAAQHLQSSAILIHDKLVCSTTYGYNQEPTVDVNIAEAARVEDKNVFGIEEANQLEKVRASVVLSNSCGKQNIADTECREASCDSITLNCLGPVEESNAIAKSIGKDLCAPLEDPECSHLIPELIASVQRVAIEGVEKEEAIIKTMADAVQHEDVAKESTANEVESADANGVAKESTTNEVESADANGVAKESTANEVESADANGGVELDSDSDKINSSKIEPTKAEAEAISRGLQTIRNDDLEEIRELGSGTYGAVYHGKWKGSDVAIKRIKASCFAGRPSERERLIADFWKEALILSSLHHPNVVSFYGIVRDGPDGSLATVTEFMVNGSLKQFLQKKDRTIDRRKRLIIAMDAAFGMEYLHGKNIVHFDLKCENLLVNMRDPQRPVCKIGDLGLSKVKQHTLVSGGIRGTLPWMAPELLSGKSNMVTEKIDVYSFGIVMWELLTGDEPYADMHCASIIGGIVNNELRPQIPTWCDPEWKCLMGSCWASDPAERPSFSEISQKLRNMASAINVK